MQHVPKHLPVDLDEMQLADHPRHLSNTFLRRELDDDQPAQARVGLDCRARRAGHELERRRLSQGFVPLEAVEPKPRKLPLGPHYDCRLVFSHAFRIGHRTAGLP